jgi:Holliday junction resolvase
MSLYKKGRAFEYRVKKLLEKNDFLVLRSPASKTINDLVAIGKDKTILFIQCKKTSTDKVYVSDNLVEMLKLAEKYDAIPLLVYAFKNTKVFCFDLRNRIKRTFKKNDKHILFENFLENLLGKRGEK